MISFAYSNFLCVWIKIIILWSLLGVSMAGYLIVEMTARRRRTDEDQGNPSSEKESKNEWNGRKMLELENNSSCDQQNNVTPKSREVQQWALNEPYRRRPWSRGCWWCISTLDNLSRGAQHNTEFLMNPKRQSFQFEDIVCYSADEQHPCSTPPWSENPFFLSFFCLSAPPVKISFSVS